MDAGLSNGLRNHYAPLCCTNIVQLEQAPQTSSIFNNVDDGANALMVFEVNVKEFVHSLRVLIDSGASQNFINKKLISLNKDLIVGTSPYFNGEMINVRLANGERKRIYNESVQLELEFK